MELHRLTTGKIFFLTLVAIVISLMIGIMIGDVKYSFEEGKISTIASVALLALIATVSFKIYNLRKLETGRWYTNPQVIWWLIGVAFIFLCLDEGLEIHEAIDHLIHKLGGISETAFTDRIDDFIILAYGLVGVVLLYVCRSEIIRIPGFTQFLVAGFAIMVVQVGIDALTNRHEYIEWFNIANENAPLVKDWAMVVEETTELLAVAVLLAGFTHALRYELKSSEATS